MNALIVTLIGAALLLVAICLYFLIAPLMGIYRVIANGDDFTSKQKYTWLLTMFAFGPVATCVFFFRHGKSKFVRRFHGGIITVFIILILGGFYADGFLRRQSINSLTAKRSHPAIQKLDVVSRAKVEQAIDSLVTDLNGLKWYEFKKVQPILSLDDLLGAQLKDNDLSLPETNEWLSNVTARQHLDSQIFETHVQDQNRTKAPNEIGGKYNLRYVTCQDPSNLTDQAKLLNQQIHAKAYSQTITIGASDLVISSTFTSSLNDQCRINELKSLEFSGSEMKAGESQNFIAIPIGGSKAADCQAKINPKELWARVATRQQDLLYLREKSQQGLCGQNPAYWTYSYVASEKETAKRGTASILDTESYTAARAQFTAGNYDEAIRLAEIDILKNPSFKSSRAVTEAARAMKRDPNNSSEKLNWQIKILHESSSDVDALLEKLKK